MSTTTPLPITTSQTIGPFPHEAWRWAFTETAPHAPIVLHGQVLDGAGEPVGDAILEASWPGRTPEAAGADGALAGVPGVHRVPTDDRGAFTIACASPPPVGEPLLHLTVFARGLLKHQFTAVFLPQPEAGELPALLAQVPPDRRPTLIAAAESDGVYRWTLRLQGADETVFFDYA